MTQGELDTIDTFEIHDYISGELSDDGKLSVTRLSDIELNRVIDFDIPAHMIPPNPDESEGE